MLLRHPSRETATMNQYIHNQTWVPQRFQFTTAPSESQHGASGAVLGSTEFESPAISPTSEWHHSASERYPGGSSSPAIPLVT